MKTNTLFKWMFGAFLIASMTVLVPACSSEDDSKEEPKQEQQAEQDDQSILEQRDEFWKGWIDKCFPNEDWNTTTFTTNGVNYDEFKAEDPAVWQAMMDMYQTPEDGDKYLPGVVTSGSTFPVEVTVSAGDKLFKLVPDGKNISGPSPYYVTQEQLDWIKAHPAELEQNLGLPLSSVSGEYWIYSITSLVDDNLFFQSTIAPTDQFTNATPKVVYKTPGGATQSLLINNGDVMKWKKSDQPDEKYIPDTLPIVE